MLPPNSKRWRFLRHAASSALAGCAICNICITPLGATEQAGPRACTLLAISSAVLAQMHWPGQAAALAGLPRVTALDCGWLVGRVSARPQGAVSALRSHQLCCTVDCRSLWQHLPEDPRAFGARFPST